MTTITVGFAALVLAGVVAGLPLPAGGVAKAAVTPSSAAATVRTAILSFMVVGTLLRFRSLPSLSPRPVTGRLSLRHRNVRILALAGGLRSSSRARGRS